MEGWTVKKIPENVANKLPWRMNEKQLVKDML